MRLLRQLVIGVLAAALLLLQSADARNPRGTATGGGPVIVNYVGANLNPMSYFSSSFPCLNTLNCAGQNGYTIWTTYPAETGNGVDGLIPVDVNGYPTSMTPTASSGVTSGAAYTDIYSFVYTNVPAVAPGQTVIYPTGSYTLSCSGADYTLTVAGTSAGPSDAVTSGAGLNLTCSHTTPASLVFQVTTPTAVGIKVSITAIGTVIPGSISLSLVQSAYLSQYTGGELFHPAFKAMLSALGYSRYRTMEWSNVWNFNKTLNFGADLPIGSTSATLSTPWALPTGTYTAQFVSGETRPVSFTWHSTAISWSSATTIDNPYYFSYVGQAWVSNIQSWAQRPTATTLAWGVANPQGVPIEVQWALVKEMNVDWWLNTFLTSGTKGMSDYVANGANYYDTQMATLVQTLTAAAPTWLANHKIYLEDQNEVWNVGNQSFFYASAIGYSLMPGTTCTAQYNSEGCAQEFLGVMTAQVSDAWKAVWGTTAFNNSIIVSMGTQTAGSQGATFLTYSMNAPDWVAQGGGHTAPSTHGIKSWHAAPYFGYTPLVTSTAGSSAQPVAITFTGAPSGLGGTTTVNVGSGCGSYPCTFLVTFSDNEVRSVTVSAATTTLTWSPTLTGSPTTAAVYGDMAAILAAADPLSTLFGLMYTNVVGGVTYPGVPAAGFIPAALANIPQASSFTGQAWFPALQLEFYEIGEGFNSNNLSGAYQTSWTALATSMARDARMQWVLHDPAHHLSSNPGYLDNLKALSPHVGNWHYGDTYAPGNGGEWGIFESALQAPLSGTGAPPKALAMEAFTY